MCPGRARGFLGGTPWPRQRVREASEKGNVRRPGKGLQPLVSVLVRDAECRDRASALSEENRVSCAPACPDEGRRAEGAERTKQRRGVGAYLAGAGKQFTQNYRWSFAYITWRTHAEHKLPHVAD